MRQTRIRALSTLIVCAIAVQVIAGSTNNILLTGYWPPSNEMVRHFSTSPKQNPAGWEGLDWEGRGYNIHSYFPEFPLGVDVDPRGEGDFEVDYQDTSEDWWRITADINPVAIITFSRGADDNSWEVERLQRNWGGPSWLRDFDAPVRPTPNPPDSSVPTNSARFSTLPMDEIVQNVAEADIGAAPYVDQLQGGGRFLSEYIAYHGVWYQDLHSDPNDPFRNVAAGHIHIGGELTNEQGRLATEVTLRTLINHVDAILIPEPSSTLLIAIGFAVLFRRPRSN